MNKSINRERKRGSLLSTKYYFLFLTKMESENPNS